METAGKFVFKKLDPQKTTDVKPMNLYLNMQKTILTELEVVIANEYSALKERRFSELTALSTQKSDLMLKLQANDQKIKLHPEASKLKTQYSADVLIIKNQMKKCQFRNRVNGDLINLCVQTSNKVQAMINKSRDVFTRNMTYNSKGSAFASGPSRLSVSA